MKYLAIDIGGTWIKGVVVTNDVPYDLSLQNVHKVKSPLQKDTSIEDFVRAMKELVALFDVTPNEINGIGISTAGIVDYHGSQVLKAAPHLNVLKNNNWKVLLEREFDCNVSIINDADAAAIGLAELGYLKGNKAIGIMPVGTGLGFTVWRNGRRWRPGKSLTLLGSIRTPGSDFDSIASASNFAATDKNNDLAHVLTATQFHGERETYIHNLANIINTAAILYTLEELVVCGGLADAATICNFPLAENLKNLLFDFPAELDKPVNIIVAKEGNQLQLFGALALAKGESVAMQQRVVHKYEALETEMPYRIDIQLHELDTSSIVQTLWQAEQEAGESLKTNLPLISEIADLVSARINSGGRLIYVGAGTSGRIAAMDAVEIPCTYGFPEDMVLALISGGISDAAIEIESGYEEDASAVPEMLLLNIRKEDSVIGISASGSAYYVQSALAFAKDRGALAVMVQTNAPQNVLPFCDCCLPLNSGNEVVAGSTRMKAGTSTKKVLNFLSSAIMIKMGKVAGSYMVDVACINNKLVERAQSILKILFGIEKQEAINLLKASNMNLGKVIQDIQKRTK